jgi:hypothetical protein
MREARRWLGVVLLGAGLAATAAAQDLAPDEAFCAPPLSTCRMGPLPLAPEQGPNVLPDDCPAGFRCVCVPSEPHAKDCAAQVCVADPERQCKTACDCEPGLGCFEGRCLPGIVPVFCCASDPCPLGEQCQHREGGFDRCPGHDPLCSERVRKVTQAVAQIVRDTGTCIQDSDCVHIDTSTRCVGTCGAFVNERRAKAALWTIKRVDTLVCDGFQEDGCPYVTPACQAQRPACIENQCQGVPIQPTPEPAS